METARRGSMRMLTAMLAASVVLPVALVGYSGWTSWGAAVRLADESNRRYIDVMREHTLNLFAMSDLIIQQTSQIVAPMSDAQIAAASRQIHDTLGTLRRQLRDVESIWIIDRDGRILADDLIDPPPRRPVTDRDYFPALRANDPGLYVGAVQQPRAPGRKAWFSIARRRVGDDGAFAGVITVSVHPDVLASFYRQITGPGGYAAIVREDGSFLMRVPELGDITHQARGLAPPRVLSADAETGSFVDRSSFDGIERLIRFRRLTGTPLYLYAGTEMATIRAAWFASFWQQIAFGLAAIAALCAALLTAMRRTQRLYAEAGRRLEMEAGLRRAQRMEAIGQLTSGVAHDFNNLLTVIAGSVDELRPLVAGARACQVLDRIEAVGEQGARLTRQLLSSARRQPLSPEAVDVAAQVRAMRDTLLRSLRGDIRVEIDTPDAPCLAKIDPSEFELALINLAVNARDAMASAGQFTVSVSNVTLDGAHTGAPGGLTGPFVRVAARDTGSGIAADLHAKVFDVFFTTKEAGKGTGLGLSQVSLFARDSGGTTTLDSAPGQGTTVTMYLPATAEQPVRRAPIAGTTPRLGAGLRALLVEDNPDVAEAVRAMLVEFGFVVRLAESGEEALKLAPLLNIHLLVSDILMPGSLSGLDLARRLRDWMPNLPIVLCTGYAERAAEAEPSGFVLLRKPFDAPRLAEALRTALRARAGGAADTVQAEVAPAAPELG